MFGPEAFAWFAGLEADNTKAYFAATRATYERAVRAPLEALLEELAEETGGGKVKVFRQQRDTRFSRDKSPYKTMTYGLIGDRPRSLAALYLQLNREGLFAGSGYYGFASDQLLRFREAVVDEGDGRALARVVEGVRTAGVEVWGEALKTAPRGFPKDHPRAPLLRHKSLIAGRRLAPAAETGAIAHEAAVAFACATWDVIAPMSAWLDRKVGASTLPPPPSRFARRG